jgi:hypothetical protein
MHHLALQVSLFMHVRRRQPYARQRTFPLATGLATRFEFDQYGARPAGHFSTRRANCVLRGLPAAPPMVVAHNQGTMQ